MAVTGLNADFTKSFYVRASLPALLSSRSPLPMTTKLDKPIRREIVIEDKPYTLTIDGDGLKLVEKGRRNGQEVRWRDLVNGDTALSAALGASTGG
jgi:hypothetical protein